MTERQQTRVALALTAALFLGTILVEVYTHQDLRDDFGELYTAGMIVRQGNGAKLYNLEEQARVEASMLNRKDLLPFIHAPFEALLYVPLTALPYSWAYMFWAIMNIVIWMAVAYLVRPYAPVPRQALQYLILCFAFFPGWIALLLGQTTIILLLIFTLVYISLERGQDLMAGILLGLGLISFQIVLPFALILLLRRQWRVIAGFSLTAAALAGVSALVVGIAGMRSYILLMLYLVNHPTSWLLAGIGPRNFPTVRGFFGTILSESFPPIWSDVLIAVLSLSVIWLAYRSWQARGMLKHGFSCALVASVLASFHLLDYDLLLLLLPILLMAGEIRHRITKAAVAVIYLPVYPVLVKFASIYWLFWPIAVFAASLFGIRKPEQV